MKFGITAASALIATGFVSSAMAGGCNYGYIGSAYCEAPSGEASSTAANYETKLFAGLQWNFGEKVPELILGVRRTETRTNDTVLGGKIDVAIPLIGDNKFGPTVRVVGLYGNENYQAETGVGLDIKRLDPLFAIGASAPYASGGVNFFLTQGMHPYVGFNSAGRVAAPKIVNGSLTCGGGLELVPVSNVLDPSSARDVSPSDQVGGFTCVSYGSG